MSEREQHINNLYDLRDELLWIFVKDKETKEKYVQSVVYAINSLEVDEAYQLEYEHIPYITLDELKEIREEISNIDIPEHTKTVDGCFGFCNALELVDIILDKKISELEGKDDGIKQG